MAAEQGSQRELARAPRLHHLALGARDVAAVAEFYGNTFELEEVARHHDASGLRAVWLDLGGAVLMVERSAQQREPAAGVSSGLFLAAFRVDPANRARLEARLAAAGSPVEARTEFSSYARDPEGNRVAISCYPLPNPASPQG
jgi:catechol 2,3-dioxygenase-like lactoylglutathione lyase family enzyme